MFTIKVSSVEESKIIQNILFRMGYRWADLTNQYLPISFKVDTYFLVKEGLITWGCRYYTECKLITIDELLDMYKKDIFTVQLTNGKACIDKATITLDTYVLTHKDVKKLAEHVLNS